MIRVMVACSPLAYSGGEIFKDPKLVNAEHQGERVLIHMKSGLKPDDSQPCVVQHVRRFRGQRLRSRCPDRRGWNGGLHRRREIQVGKYRLPAPMVKAVAAELNMDPGDFPETYM